MNTRIAERTIEGKVYTAQDILPWIGSCCADWGRDNSEQGVDFFPSQDEWGMVVDWLGDFGEFPGGKKSYEFSDEFIEALAKEYVGMPEEKPDPHFFENLKKKYKIQG